MKQMGNATSALHAGLNPEQLQVVEHDKGALRVGAVAGAGKTKTLVTRCARLVEKGAAPHRILALTFSKDAADEMNERLNALLPGSGARVGTFHSFCLEVLRTEGRDFEVDGKDRYRVIAKQVLGFQGMNWSQADVTLVLEFIGRCKAAGDAAGSQQAMMRAQNYYQRKPGPSTTPRLLCEAYERIEMERKSRGLITFDDMLLDVANLFTSDEAARLRWSNRYDYVLQDECQDVSPVQNAIAKAMATDHGNYMVVGDPSQCHPAGTMIQVGPGPLESRPIEALRDGDTVMGWNQNAQKMVGGRSIAISSRRYVGRMLTIRADGRAVDVTPNHRFVARWRRRARETQTCVTYLMYRADLGYRVGWCKLFSNGGPESVSLHLAQRARIEKADAVWVLTTHETRTGASVMESIIAARYGIPTSTFEPVDGAAHQTTEAIQCIFDAVRDHNWSRGVDCLHDHGRDETLPLYPWPGKKKDQPQGRRTIFQVYGCNIIPELMAIPLPSGVNQWTTVDGVDSRQFDGDVYSLAVAVDETYAANGLVVHNCIYGFRGADVTSLTRFHLEWPGMADVMMCRNYRSGRQIAAAANGVLRAMKVRLEGLEIQAERDLDGLVTTAAYEDQDDEARCIAADMQAIHEDGDRWGDMFVLFRTNAQSRAMEEALLGERIPHRVVGGTAFYARKEVADVLSYLRAATPGSRWEQVKRSINAPFRYLAAAFLKRCEEEAAQEPAGVEQDWPALVRRVCRQGGVQSRQVASAEEWASLIDWIKREMAKGPASSEGRALPAALLERIVMATRFIEWLTKDEGEETVENSRASNVRELIRAAEKFTTVEEFLSHVDETIQRSNQERNRKDGNRVLLMSVHKSKGLEAKHVWVISCNDRILPHARAVQEPDGMEEERRLAYVAFTRARDSLRISWVRSAVVGPKVVKLGPSCFIAEAGLPPETRSQPTMQQTLELLGGAS